MGSKTGHGQRKRHGGAHATGTETDSWRKCPDCDSIIFIKEVRRNHDVCTACGHHFRIGAWRRIDLVADQDSFVELFGDLETTDPIGFTDSLPYPDRIEKAREKSGTTEAVIVGRADILERKVILSVMDFFFMGGSMGSVVGEKITRAIETAIKEELPFVSFTASGGARMQEGLISLLQMAKTTSAVSRLKQTRIPYISILTDPTTGGIAASFAMLGDIVIAEPGAVIGFTGRRVIESTINQKPPENFQQAEEILKHGMIDKIVERKQIRTTIRKLLDFLAPLS
ncbi:MAG: acetyl-CoA carboxylase carboxyltransferase subunit beta [Deltaproteobacteria bacterium]|nr:acetyl-CoA carboxylase carboxyltransferase subunit beta [Candidatus Zymogenaceae bacterium]